MERCRPSSSMFEPATYRIRIQGTLDKHWSEYFGGMTIERESDPRRCAMSILTGLLVDQSALIGVLISLHDTGYPILLVECIEAGTPRILSAAVSCAVEQLGVTSNHAGRRR
jgi:hypothetical protein